MITYISKTSNAFNIKFKGYNKYNLTAKVIQSMYDFLILDADLVCTCPICKTHSLIKWGYYYRTFILFGIYARLAIRRFRCKSCGKTHAVHVIPIIGYCQVSLESMIDILTKDMNDISLSYFDNSYIYRKRNEYKEKWKPRLQKLGIDQIQDPPVSMCISIIKTYLRQFMQNHCGNTYLFFPPT